MWIGQHVVMSWLIRRILTTVTIRDASESKGERLKCKLRTFSKANMKLMISEFFQPGETDSDKYNHVTASSRSETTANILWYWNAEVILIYIRNTRATERIMKGECHPRWLYSKHAENRQT